MENERPKLDFCREMCLHDLQDNEYTHLSSSLQIKRVVNQLREISPSKKLPLVVLHQKRVTSGPAQSPNNKKLLESLKRAGALYATPVGSNDDW